MDWRIEPDVARAGWAGPGGRVQLLGIHLQRPWGSTAQDAAQQLGRLAELARRYEACSLIVAGDFNLSSWSGSLRWLERMTGLRRLDGIETTWPARAPLGLAVLPLDHILATPDWRAIRVRRGVDIGATHYPLVADLVRVDAPAGLRPSPCPGKPEPHTGRPA